MVGWISQKYSNVPGLLNVCEKVRPRWRDDGVLNSLPTRSGVPCVTVCGASSWLSHCTVVPTVTLTFGCVKLAMLD